MMRKYHNCIVNNSIMLYDYNYLYNIYIYKFFCNIILIQIENTHVYFPSINHNIIVHFWDPISLTMIDSLWNLAFKGIKG